jgi:hypothetical protein
MTRRRRIAMTAAMFLAGPALVVLGGILYEHDAPRNVVSILQVAGWLGGPVLMAWAVVILVRQERRTHPEMRSRRVGLPSTRPGWISAGLLAGFTGLLVLFFGIVAVADQRGGDTFFSNLYLATPILLAAACGILAGAAAIYAVAFRSERSILTFVALAAGLLVLVFSLGEIGGHDEQGSKGGANSHSRVSAVEVSATEVRVSFDYSYNLDPPGRTITAITVTALGQDGRPLAGHAPYEMPITRGSGHADPILTFSAGQAAGLAGFTVCFTAPDEPDLGCARIAYPPR